MDQKRLSTPGLSGVGTQPEVYEQISIVLHHFIVLLLCYFSLVGWFWPLISAFKPVMNKKNFKVIPRSIDSFLDNAMIAGLWAHFSVLVREHRAQFKFASVCTESGSRRFGGE